MPDYTVTVPAEDYKNLIRKAIAFDMVCKVVECVNPFQWGGILKPLCFSIVPEGQDADENR